MRSIDALRVLAELTSYQWGMVTSAQASMHGITRLGLSRLAEAGHLVRLIHGVYMDAGAPGDEFDDLRAAWLSTEPKRLAEERMGDRANGVVIAGESASRLHRIGDLQADRHDFVSPVRRQSQRQEVRHRQRALDPGDITLVEGLPVMTLERTIADLVEDLRDLSLVADALRDASGKRAVDLDRLRQLLAPLAERNGFGKGDGGGLLDRLMEVAGIDLESLARRVAADPALGSRVAADVVGRLGTTDLDRIFVTPEMQQALRSIQETIAKTIQNAVTPQLMGLDGPARAAAAALSNSAGTQEMLRKISEQVASSDAIREVSRSLAQSVAASYTVSPEILRAMSTRRTVSGD